MLSPAVVINADKNMYALGQDVLAVLDRACLETIPMLRSALLSCVCALALVLHFTQA